MQRFLKAVAAIMLMTAVLTFIGCKKSGDSDVRVTTYTPQYITATTAKCGGDVIVTQGLTLTEFGVCWSKERNPIAENLHLFTSNWSEPYVCTITDLEPDTKYYVRAYALRGLEYYYGEEKSFITESVGGGLDNHTWVDLGLPSGTLWATCNVGANAPEEFGYYFAWGEIQPKDTFNWDTYKYCKNGNEYLLTKYCDDASYGYNNFIDNLTMLQHSDDAATANWGNDWRIPTVEEWEELSQNTTYTTTTQHGVFGCLFTAVNGNSIFLPAAGICMGGTVYHDICSCYYWSSSLSYGGPNRAYNFVVDAGIGFRNHRCFGQSVRAVRSPLRLNL